MRTTIELAKECGAIELKFNLQNEFANKYQLQINQLEAFRKACEADFISRCEKYYGIVDTGTFVAVEESEEGAIRMRERMNLYDCNDYTYEPLYALPKETK